MEEGQWVFFVSVCDRRREIDPLLRILRVLWCVMWRNKRLWRVLGVGRGGRSFLSDVFQLASVCLAVRAQQLRGGATGMPARIVCILTMAKLRKVAGSRAEGPVTVREAKVTGQGWRSHVVVWLGQTI